MAIAWTDEHYNTDDFGPSGIDVDITSLTVPSGTKKMLALCGYKNNTQSDCGPVSITWDYGSTNQAMTEKVEGSGDSTNRWSNMQAWELDNPTVGNNTMRVTKGVNRSEEFSMTVYYFSTSGLLIGATTFEDIGSTTTVIYKNITTTVANSVIFGGCHIYASATPAQLTERANTTEDNVTALTADYKANGAQGHRVCTTVGSYELGWTADRNSRGGLVIVEITEGAAQIYDHIVQGCVRRAITRGIQQIP